FLALRRPPTSPLFPYTTLFRSARMKSGMKAGDFLLIQFGTNDETHTCPRYVALADFEADLGLMADTARAKGAIPIFVTPMGHRSDRKSTRLNSSHVSISYAVFC